MLFVKTNVYRIVVHSQTFFHLLGASFSLFEPNRYKKNSEGNTLNAWGINYRRMKYLCFFFLGGAEMAVYL